MLSILMSYLILLPAAALCYLPMRDLLKRRRTVSFVFLFALLSVLIILATILTYRLGLKENDLLIPLLVLCFLCFHFSLNAPLVKTLTVYAAVVALLSILTIYAACYDASVSPSSGLGTFTLSLPLAQLAVTILATSLLAYPFARYGKFLIEQPFSSWAWVAIILFSLTIFVTNIAIYPIVYFLFKEDLATLNVVLVVTAQLIVWVLMLVILYSVISDTLAMSKMREQNRIMELKESQFRSQQKYIRASERTRHDFRHNVQTLTELYEAGDMEELGKYLHQFVESVPANETAAFCGNAALNALLNYYVHVTALNKIRFTLQIKLPEELPVSDVDLCSMVGNILENAVIACQEAEEKTIRLAVIGEPDGQLYLVAVNSFNGIVRQKNGTYYSTKRKQAGVGLSSVAATAESYGGVAQFSHEGKQFFSNVAIPLV